MAKLTIATPTPLKILLDDERYNAYFLKTTRQLNSQPPHWMVLSELHNGRWRRGTHDRFKQALTLGLSQLGRSEVRDISIVSRARLFREPQWAFELKEPGEEWCGRCRRYSLFLPWPHSYHRAIPPNIPVRPNLNRCYFCGITEEMK